MQREKAEAVIVYAVVDDALSPDFPLGVELEVFVRREDAERFIEEVRADEPELARKLRIEERELDAGGLNQGSSLGRKRGSVLAFARRRRIAPQSRRTPQYSTATERLARGGRQAPGGPSLESWAKSRGGPRIPFVLLEAP